MFSTAQAPFAGLLIAIAVVAAAQVVVRTAAHGPAVTGNSVIIVAIAEHLHAGNGLTDLRGRGLLAAPPLYPGLLAAGSLVAGLTTADVARMVNAAAVGALALVAGVWLAGNIRSRLLAAGTATVLTVCGPVAHFAASLHSGVLFALFAVLALTQLTQTPNAPKHPHRAALFTMLAAATEFAGVTLIITGVMIVLLRSSSVRGAERALEGDTGALRRLARTSAANWRAAALFGAIASWPLIVVLLHNAAAFGVALPSSDQWRAGYETFAAAPTGTAVLRPAGDHAEYWLYALLALLGLVGARMGRQPHRLHRQQLRVFAVFACVYALAALTGLASGFVGDSGAARVLPLLGPALLAAALLVDDLAPTLLRLRWTRAALTIAAGAVCVVGARRELAISLNAVERGYWGRAYNTPHWQNKGTIPHLLRHGLSSGYSNRPNLLRFSLGTLGVDTDDAAGERYRRLPRNLADLPATLAAEATIVWFYDAPPPGVRLRHPRAA